MHLVEEKSGGSREYALVFYPMVYTIIVKIAYLKWEENKKRMNIKEGTGPFRKKGAWAGFSLQRKEKI